MTNSQRLDFIPGTMCDERVWSRVLPHIGIGFSANYVPLEGSLDREAMRRRLRECTGEKANLIGFSMGGYLALEHALAHPERVKSLTIISASAKGFMPHEKSRREQVLRHLQGRHYTGMPMAQILSLLGRASHADAEAIRLIQDMDRDLGKETLLSQLSATMDRPDRTEELPNLSCPVLIVGAREDSLVRSADLEQMRNALPDGELVMLESGHMIPLEAGEALGKHLSAFLRRVAG